jgi:hypothetical protein
MLGALLASAGLELPRHHARPHPSRHQQQVQLQEVRLSVFDRIIRAVSDAEGEGWRGLKLNYMGLKVVKFVTQYKKYLAVFKMTYVEKPAEVLTSIRLASHLVRASNS